MRPTAARAPLKRSVAWAETQDSRNPVESVSDGGSGERTALPRDRRTVRYSSITLSQHNVNRARCAEPPNVFLILSCASFDAARPAGQDGTRDCRRRRARTGLADPRIPRTLARRTPFRRASRSLSADASGVELRKHGTVSDADTIRDTAVAQPLIVAASLLSFAAVTDGGRRDKLAGVAGHSVGELAAAAAAGILTEDDAMKLVTQRGVAMAEAASKVQTGMSAVLGGDEAELLAKLAELGLEPANFNGGGQIVVAGELPALAALQEAPPAGARVIPLQVAGAFHTRFMAPAVDTLRAVAAGLEPADPTLPIWTNKSRRRRSPTAACSST